ncbi:uncharacterized protein [Amphiura filiformis]|uniref:uncharacterized protein n=1 Tax=Amphiura filiformis TaxID=82378 RepID=UPI003B20E140
MVTHKTAVQGEVVTFQCTLEEARPPGYIYWLIEWNDGTTLITTAHESYQLSDDTLSDRGFYRSVYQPSGTVFTYTHLCTLEIAEVSKIDEGSFSCIHDGWTWNRGRFFTATLSILDGAPRGSPKCSYTLDEGDGSELTVGSVVQLACSLDGGDHNELIWYQSRNEVISSTTGDYVNYTLKDMDNGEDLICRTSGLANQQECRVMPFAQLPNAIITPIKPQISSGNNASFTCCGQGIPYVSHYEWYLNGSVVINGQRGGRIRITSSGICNQLQILNLTSKENATRVLCEVSIPSGLSASAAAVLIVTEAGEIVAISTPTTQEPHHTTPDRPTSNVASVSGMLRTDNDDDIAFTINHVDRVVLPEPKQPSASPRPHSKKMMFIGIGICIALITGVTIVAIIVVKYRRHRTRHLDGKNVSSNTSKAQTPLTDKHPVTQTAFSMPDVIYQDNIIYNHDAADTETAVTQRLGSERNVEGLTYASLQLNECTYGNEILNPSAAEKVMYADVR